MCSAARRRAVGLGVRGAGLGRGSTGTVSHRGRIIRAAWSRVTGTVTVTVTVVRVPGTFPIQSVTVGKRFVHFWDSSLFRSPCGQWTSLWQLEVAVDTLTVA
jgi:hypothetical protein